VKSRGSGRRDYKGKPLDSRFEYCFHWYTLSAERESGSRRNFARLQLRPSRYN